MIRRTLLLLILFMAGHLIGQLAGPTDLQEICRETRFGYLCWIMEDTRRFVAEQVSKPYRVRPVWTPQDTAALIHELDGIERRGDR